MSASESDQASQLGKRVGMEQLGPGWVSKHLLVGGLEHFLFSPIAGMMIQSDFHIFQRD